MKAITYSLKVWLTGVILGSVIFLIMNLLEEPASARAQTDMVGLVPVILTFAFLFSLPSLGLLTGTVAFIERFNMSQLTKKLILTGIGILLTMLPLYYLFNDWYDVLKYTGPYSSMIILGIWVY